MDNVEKKITIIKNKKDTHEHRQQIVFLLDIISMLFITYNVYSLFNLII